MKQEQELEIIHKGIDFANTLKTESEPYKSGAGYGYSCGYAAAQEEYATQSTQERGTVEAAKEYAKDFYNSNHALDGMPKSIIDDAHRLAALHFSKGCEYSAHLSAKKIKKLEDELERFGEVAESKVEELEEVSATDKKRIEELEKEVERLRGLVEEAHLNGFKLSGEGWNGEYPFNDCKVEIKTDETYNAYWEQFKADNNL